MRALITGINGFVGGHLSDILLKSGFEIFGIDKDGDEGVDITDKKKVFEVVKETKPDFIFHLAAISSVQTCRENPELTEKVNVIGTENLLSSCVDNRINPRILIASSAHVYGIPEKVPIDENHPVNPVNEYGKSKLEQERVALKYRGKLDIVISRSFNHMGPNQATGFVCSDFAKQIAEIEKGIRKWEIHVGDLSSKRDFTDVRDIVRAYLLLLEKGSAGEIYNVGSGVSHSIKEILDKLVSKSVEKIDIIEDKELLRKSDIPILVANNTKFVELTGWKPVISIDDSLNEILDWWRSQV